MLTGLDGLAASQCTPPRLVKYSSTHCHHSSSLTPDDDLFWRSARTRRSKSLGAGGVVAGGVVAGAVCRFQNDDPGLTHSYRRLAAVSLAVLGFAARAAICGDTHAHRHLPMCVAGAAFQAGPKADRSYGQ